MTVSESVPSPYRPDMDQAGSCNRWTQQDLAEMGGSVVVHLLAAKGLPAVVRPVPPNGVQILPAHPQDTVPGDCRLIIQGVAGWVGGLINHANTTGIALRFGVPIGGSVPETVRRQADRYLDAWSWLWSWQ